VYWHLHYNSLANYTLSPASRTSQAEQHDLHKHFYCRQRPSSAAHNYERSDGSWQTSRLWIESVWYSGRFYRGENKLHRWQALLLAPMVREGVKWGFVRTNIRSVSLHELAEDWADWGVISRSKILPGRIYMGI